LGKVLAGNWFKRRTWINRGVEKSRQPKDEQYADGRAAMTTTNTLKYVELKNSIHRLPSGSKDSAD
jgi:hypothetical protein